MRVCGVVCEYNPFHRGHAMHLTAARVQSPADYVVCVMSGALTQRGAFARHDKWTRARMALCGGADLVLELPARFACASAQDFARGGVGLLAALGVVTHLSFGCEPEALGFLAPAMRILSREPPSFRAVMRRALQSGASFPRAKALALEAAYAGETVTPEVPQGRPGMADALSLPNATLAVEYLLALPPEITPVPIRREGGGYHDEQFGTIPSANAVRRALERGETKAALAAVPFPQLLAAAEARGDTHRPDALDQALLYRLRSATPQELALVPGMDEGLEHRFLAAARECASREDLLARVKTRRYTYARLSRLCALALLGATRETYARCPAPPYARVLGFRRDAAPLLRAIKRNGSIPLVTKAAAYDRGDPLFALDLRAQDLWSLGCENPALRACGRDLTTGPVIL